MSAADDRTPTHNVALATAIKLAQTASERAARSIRCRGALRNARASFERATNELRHSAGDLDGKGKL